MMAPIKVHTKPASNAKSEYPKERAPPFWSDAMNAKDAIPARATAMSVSTPKADFGALLMTSPPVMAANSIARMPRPKAARPATAVSTSRPRDDSFMRLRNENDEQSSGEHISASRSPTCIDLLSSVAVSQERVNVPAASNNPPMNNNTTDVLIQGHHIDNVRKIARVAARSSGYRT